MSNDNTFFYKRKNFTSIPTGKELVRQIANIIVGMLEDIPSVKNRIVPMLWGEPGIGKTATGRAVAQEIGRRLGMDWHFIHVPMGQFQPEDLGIPFRVEGSEGPYFEMLLAPWVREAQEKAKEGKVVLVNLDEANRGYGGNAVASILSDRKVHNHPLHENVFLMATGNPPTRGFKVQDWFAEKSQTRRVLHIWVECEALNVVAHAKEEGWYPLVIEYLETFLEDVLDLEAREAGKIYANPATWAKVSSFLHMNKGDVVGNWVSLAGLLGVDKAQKFMEFCANKRFQVKPETILNNWPKAKGVLDIMKAEGRGDLISSVVKVFATFLFSSKPEHKVAGPAVARFWASLSEEQMVLLNDHFTSLEEKEGNTAYWNLVHGSLAKTVEWKETILPVLTHVKKA